MTVNGLDFQFDVGNGPYLFLFFLGCLAIIAILSIIKLVYRKSVRGTLAGEIGHYLSVIRLKFILFTVLYAVIALSVFLADFAVSNF